MGVKFNHHTIEFALAVGDAGELRARLFCGAGVPPAQAPRPILPTKVTPYPSASARCSTARLLARHTARRRRDSPRRSERTPRNIRCCESYDRTILFPKWGPVAQVSD